MQHVITTGLFAPLIGFLILLFSSPIIKRRLTGIIACTTLFISFCCFSSIIFLAHDLDLKFSLFKWISFAGIDADFMLHLDSLSLLMCLIITGVGFLIHVYSIGYMEHENDYARYFACLNFFVFSMLLLVLAGHLLLLFVGWEGVGLASYLLIGFWYERPSAASAATKAFVVNRIGDLGLLLGILLTLYTFGTGNMETISDMASHKFAVGAPLITIITLLYFVGATGKSAQLPLHTWLPDAMEGPTPVSALIHAATMVTAGVYLVVRMHPLFLLSPFTLQVVGVIGGVTALFAALCALAQTDLKRVLAYSTISQLGFMFLACGAGAFYSAMFHLTTHAFMKALLFLSAGNVLHMMHDITDMNRMGGLARKLPVTNWLFLIGVLAMSGIPPLAAFFSKDLILEQEHLAGFEVLYYIAFAASVLTAIYLMRAYCLTFWGTPRASSYIWNSIQEAPRIMIIPLILLAVLAILGGFLGYTFNYTPPLEEFLDEISMTSAEQHLLSTEFFNSETLTTLVAVLVAMGGTILMYTTFADYLLPSLTVLKRAFFVDEIYDFIFVRPLKAVAKGIASIVEPRVFDESIRVSARSTQGIAQHLQNWQNGQIRSYVACFVLGTVLLIAYLVH
ncbi:MAG: NADH-quinone oxidoreductase subunit L [Parachlamydiaceae bacterium]|nr:NADH-quinone oxidoreductase subunit L [Parachlamydiaceae bacterium]